MRRYAYPRVHKTHNGHACMNSNIYKRVHLPVYSTCIVLGITMTGQCRLQKGYVKVSKNKNLSQTRQ